MSKMDLESLWRKEPLISLKEVPILPKGDSSYPRAHQ